MVNLFFAFLLLCSFQRSIMVGLTRLELVISRLSGVRSNQMSYRPIRHPKSSEETNPSKLNKVSNHVQIP